MIPPELTCTNVCQDVLALKNARIRDQLLLALSLSCCARHVVALEVQAHQVSANHCSARLVGLTTCQAMGLEPYCLRC